MSSSCARGNLGWILRKFLHGKGCKVLEEAVGESSSLGMSKKSVAVAPGDTVRDDQAGALLMVGLDNH